MQFVRKGFCAFTATDWKVLTFWASDRSHFLHHLRHELTEVTKTLSYVCTEKDLTIKKQFHLLEQPASNFSIFCPFAFWKYSNSVFSWSSDCYLSQHLSIWEIFRFHTNQISWVKWWNAKTPAINISLVYL